MYKKGDVPDSLHFKHNRRIASIFGLMKEGWYLRRSKLPEIKQPEGVIRGDHGYNNSIKDMYPLFIARGPAFKENLISEPFELTDIYPLISHILGIEPAPNNGSLSRVQQLLRERSPTTSSSAPESNGNKITGFTILGVAAFVCFISWPQLF